MTTHPPLAEAIGPFADPAFLDVVHRHHPRGEFRVLSDAAGWLALEAVDGGHEGVGHRDLIDYRSPLGTSASELLAGLAGPIRLDSLPAETGNDLAAGLRERGRRVVVTETDTTAVLHLPTDPDEWFVALGKKERHETRRKRRRHEASVGPVTLEVTTASDHRFEAFVALHRRSPGEKGSFMTDPMAAYFEALLGLDGWSVSSLVDGDGATMAAGFGFADDDGYYLYNSSLDPSRQDLSPGVVLVSELILSSITAGRSRFDFLKGDETYKYRLGATARQLVDLEVAP